MKIKALAAVAIVAALALTGCSGNSDLTERNALQDSVTVANSLEKVNLKEKLSREDDPEAIRYVYLMNFGEVVGYYVTKGKISSSGSQLAPEQEILRPISGEYIAVDSAQDDGTYGTGDPGIFFFTSDGTMVATSLDYIQSDAPLAIDVPRLGGTE